MGPYVTPTQWPSDNETSTLCPFGSLKGSHVPRAGVPSHESWDPLSLPAKTFSTDNCDCPPVQGTWCWLVGMVGVISVKAMSLRALFLPFQSRGLRGLLLPQPIPPWAFPAACQDPDSLPGSVAMDMQVVIKLKCLSYQKNPLAA